MLGGIVAGGLTLALVSGGAFLVALPALGVDSARMLALVSWMMGHAVLGIVMGWERTPVAVSALRTNWAMLAWAGAAAAFVLGLVVIPPFAAPLHAGRVPVQALLLACGAAVLVPLWLELA
jgi:hypothetical protein